MKIKGAIFDMDGTLIDSLSFWDHFWKLIGSRYLQKNDFKACEEVDKRIRTMIYTDAMAYIREYYGITEPIEDFLHFTKATLTDFYKNSAPVKQGAVALLEHLASLGISLCLASASPIKDVRFNLSVHGLDKYFDTVLSCADIGVGKDQPDIYLLALEKMGLGAAEVCVFEDSFIALETAKAAGFQTVGIYDDHNYEQGRLRCASDFYLEKGRGLDTLIAICEK